MSTATTQDRIYRIVSQVFGVSVDSINDDTSPDTVEEWDSLSHIGLILALETEFDLSLSPEDAMQMLSVKLIRLILEERGLK